MVLFALVATHAQVDLETVAQLSAGANAVSDSAVVLATCNRLEIYSEAASGEHAQDDSIAIINTLASHAGVSTEIAQRAFTLLTESEVSSHLFSVAAGLDSAVVGEREIAGQVRRALSQAQSTFAVPGAVTKLFQNASRTAKAVGSQTALGSQGRSVVSVALDLAADLSETSWPQRQAVVFGTGAYAGVTMALLRERGVRDIQVYSPSGRAKAFADSRGGAAVETIQDALAHADLVIGCSGSDSQVSADNLAKIRGEDAAPLTIVDLALTHDFDPLVSALPSVDLLTLESVRMAAPEEQESALEQATAIVQEAAEKFEQEQAARSIDSAIVALRQHTMKVLDEELERVRAQHGCTAAAEEVEFALRRMVKQLLHIPTVRARELAASGRQADYAVALDTLYGIHVTIPGAVAAAVEPEDSKSALIQAPASCPVDHNNSLIQPRSVQRQLA